MSYVLRMVACPHPKYVAQPGSRHSYTTELAKARRFPTRQAAEYDRCGNEVVMEL